MACPRRCPSPCAIAWAARSRRDRPACRPQYIEGDKPVDLVYYAQPKQWRKEQDNVSGTPFVGEGNQHPDVNQDAARVWTAPKAGHVRVTAAVCNTGNLAAVTRT